MTHRQCTPCQTSGPQLIFSLLAAHNFNGHLSTKKRTKLLGRASNRVTGWILLYLSFKPMYPSLLQKTILDLRWSIFHFFFCSDFHNYSENCWQVQKMTLSKCQLDNIYSGKITGLIRIWAILLVRIVYTDAHKKHTSWNKICTSLVSLRI